MATSIEIFRAGTHVSDTGETIAFAAADVAAIAQAYDPAVHEAPVVVGHPAADAPAYGWVAGLTAEDGRLRAALGQLDPGFAELVRAGRYKKVSASLYRPEGRGNPQPGSWYLRHVGFLGARPPAVKGLRPVDLAEADGAVTLDLGDAADGPLARLARLLPSLGRARADRVPAGARPPSEEPPSPSPEGGAGAEDAIARRLAELERREAAARRAEDGRFLDRLVAEARLPAGRRDLALELMERLQAGDGVSFGEETVPATEAFRRLLAGLAPLVELGERAAAAAEFAEPFELPAGAAADPDGLVLHARALAWQRAHPGTRYLDAVRAVGG